MFNFNGIRFWLSGTCDSTSKNCDQNFIGYKSALRFLLGSFIVLLASCAVTNNTDYANTSHTDIIPSANKGLLVASITRDINALTQRGAIAFFFVRDKKTGIEFEMSSKSSRQRNSNELSKVGTNISELNEPNTSVGVNNKLLSYTSESEEVSLTLASDIASAKDQAGSVLAFELKPGMYEISKWKLITAGGEDFAYFDSEHRPPITFEVKSGEVSYLCNCHIDLDMGENIFGLAVEDGAEAAIYDKMHRDMQYVDDKYPNLRDLKVNNIAANLRIIEHPLAP